MRTFTETVKLDLENLRKILKMRKKYVGNVTYKEKEREITLEMDRDFKRLIAFVKKQKIPKIISEAEKLNDYIEYLTKPGTDIARRFIDIDEALKLLNNLEVITESIPKPTDISFLPATVIKNLGRRFETEIKDLNLVYSEKSGTCTSFMLRKILEKAVFLIFAKNKLISRLKDPKNSKRFVGLERMIELASSTEAKDGTPMLLPKIADELIKIKFLGDDAAHDFLYNVDIDIVEKEKTYISIAIGQLAQNL